MTPRFSAVFPDADAHESLTGTWEWLEVPASGTWGPSTPRLPAPPQTTVSANTRATSAEVSGLSHEKRYAFRARGTDPAPQSQTSPWSRWCVFTVDIEAPPVTVTTVTPPVGVGQPGTFRFDSPASDVVKFRYGWGEPGTSEVPATAGGTGKTATVTLVPPGIGLNLLFARAIDATGLRGPASSVDVVVSPPSVAVAVWLLEAYPGITEEDALADQGERSGFTPLTPYGLTWAPDVRLIGARTAGFGGAATSFASAGAPVVSTSQTFSVTAWARTPSLPCTGRQTVASIDGTYTSAFALTFDCATAKWGMRLADADRAGAATVDAWAPTPAKAGLWQHLIGSWDATAREVLLYVDGVRVAAATPAGGWLDTYGDGWDATGPFVLGRDRLDGADGGGFAGQIANVRVYDRLLLAGDLFGDPATSTVGVVLPTPVGRYTFETGGGTCYDDTIDPTYCMELALDLWARNLFLTRGTWVESESGASVLELDGTHWAEEGDPLHGVATVEYGVTKRNVAELGEPEQWVDAPVLRTDQSYTVSAWVRPDRVAGDDMTVLAQRGSDRSAFHLGVRNRTEGGVTRQHWTFTTAPADGPSAEPAATAVAPQPLTVDDTTTWTHLVGVYDATRGQIRLYVNGVLAATADQSYAWQASGPLVVGAAGSGAAAGELWFGGVDDVYAFRGAMTDAQVAELHDQQD
ncbi:LamG-like jellyroll fold domain-containing protein [Phytohabitans sp. ZYX-F-186]|uniref:LamG-like jellyroll fold domain-containing protein n=1 Tax=Phytohabitans maris TaxID=3071409 RepID=A0ABU0Z9N1_9ACTN|nr:LamG-like jellyroll fold domain-containing protein [Phytohabitans sp. ZYX-F-186]MDQ7903111.1 LamG-like jellyroll fold domain-containing protein [Phytohabitans sp. ZYX-F-186]